MVEVCPTVQVPTDFTSNMFYDDESGPNSAKTLLVKHFVMAAHLLPLAFHWRSTLDFKALIGADQIFFQD